MVQIGEASEQAGLSTKTIRYYEEIGLIPPAKLMANGYRAYSEDELDRLRFIRTVGALNFPLEDIEEILAFRDRGKPCSYVMRLMEAQIEGISLRIRALGSLREELRR